MERTLGMGRIERGDAVWWSDTEESRSAEETNNKWVGGRTAADLILLRWQHLSLTLPSRGENNREKIKR